MIVCNKAIATKWNIDNNLQIEIEQHAMQPRLSPNTHAFHECNVIYNWNDDHKKHTIIQ